MSEAREKKTKQSALDRERLAKATKELSKASQEIVHQSRYIFDEGDRWVLTALRTLNHGAEKTKQGLGSLGRYVADRSPLRVDVGRKTPKERIQRLLHQEARKAKLDVPEEHFAQFAEQMSTLLHLVITGTLRVEDVGFEQEVLPDADSAQYAQPQNAQPQNAQPQNAQPQNAQPQNGQLQNRQPQNGQLQDDAFSRAGRTSPQPAE